MDQFVLVRLVKCNALDLATFQFDFDLTFSVFFLHADGTILGRYGSRLQREADHDISMDGLRRSIESALWLHKNFDTYKKPLAAKTGPPPRYPVPEKYPALAGKYTAKLDYENNVAHSCIHCHQIRDSELRLFRDGGKPIPDEVLYPWPAPGVVGLELDVDQRVTVKSVTKVSAAASAGFRAGDEILMLQGQPLVSPADIQWVLHNAGDAATLHARILRDGKASTLKLVLGPGWRRRSELAWRPTTWNLRRMGTGGLVLEHLPEADREKLDLPADTLALRVKHVGQYGDHAAAKRAGFKKDDVVVELDGRSEPMRETDLLAYAVQRKKRGEQVPVTVLRAGKRVLLKLPMQ